MHKVLKAFPCAFDGIHSESLAVGDEREFGSMADGLMKAGLIGDIDDAAAKAEAAAKTKADEKAAKEAAKAAAKAEAERQKAHAAIMADLEKLSDEDLVKIVADEKVEVDENDDRDAILDKIANARMAAE